MIKQETPVKQERRERLEDADYDALCNFLEENGAKVYYGIASDTLKTWMKSFLNATFKNVHLKLAT